MTKQTWTARNARSFGQYDADTDSYVMGYDNRGTFYRLRFRSQESCEHAMRTWLYDGAIAGLPGDPGVDVGSAFDWVTA